jgi:anti-sigma factor RsiW
MTTSPLDKDLTLLLNGYLDGELDPIAARDIEWRLTSDPAAAHEFAELKALRSALRTDLSNDVPSDRLKRQIGSIARRPLRSQPIPSWQALAASALIGAVIAGSGTFGAMNYGRGSGLTDAVVASHIRALMAPQPIDVLSSDRHTVKPWFDGKLAFAPDVVDLAPQGFPLVGGRVDVIDFQPVPTLVYRAGKHLVSLTAIPGDRRMGIGLRAADDRGFHTVAWKSREVLYVAVSDAAPDALDSFVKAIRTAIGP